MNGISKLWVDIWTQNSPHSHFRTGVPAPEIIGNTLVGSTQAFKNLYHWIELSWSLVFDKLYGKFNWKRKQH